MDKESEIKSVSFSGHRPEKISGMNALAERSIRRAANLAIREHYTQGYREFLSGMAPGFDLWAAEEVISLRNDGFDDIRLTAVVPFEGHERSVGTAFADVYRSVLAAAQNVVVLEKSYSPNCYLRRNDYLVDNAAALICYCEKRTGGTAYTLKEARKRGLRVTNLASPELFR